MDDPTPPRPNRPGGFRLIMVTLLSAGLLALAIVAWPEPDPAFGRIGFDLAQLDDEGLYGPREDRRPRVYALCLPDSGADRDRAMAVDSTLRFEPAPADAGCRTGEVLAIGNTRQPGWRDVLARLARLPAVRRIEAWYVY